MTSGGGSAKTTIILVHGVGLPGENLFGTKLPGILEKLSIGAHEIVEIDWHRVVPQPLRSRFSLNYDHFRGLMRGFVGASARAPDPNVMQRAFHFLMLLAPLVILLQAWRLWHMPTWLATELRWYGLIAGLAAVLLLLESVIRLGRKGLHQAFRQIFIALLWPFVFLFTHALSTVGAVIWTIATLIAAFCFYLFYWPDTYALTATGAPIVGGTNVALAFSSLAVLAIGSAAFWSVASVTHILRAPLKVIADVICFMGDRQYYELLMGHLSARFASIDFATSSRVLIVGHSLGSAIVIAHLAHNPPPLPGDCWLHVVTMGSPLFRMLQRFFPSVWPDCDAIGKALSGCHGRFSWTNVYRPFDPIGGSIFTRGTERLRDVSTRQYGLPPSRAHVGYWEDPKAVEAIRRAVLDQEQRGPAVSADPCADVRIGGDRSWEATRALNEIYDRLLASWIPVTVLGALLFLAAIPLLFEMNRVAEKESAAKATMMQNHEDTVGWLYLFLAFSRYRIDHGYGEAVVFRPEGRAPVVRLREPYPTFSHGEKCYVFYESAKGQRVDALRIPVRVTYARQDPSRYYLPDYEQSPWRAVPPAGPISSVMGVVVLSVCCVGMCLMIGDALARMLPLYLGSARKIPLAPLVARAVHWLESERLPL